MFRLKNFCLLWFESWVKSNGLLNGSQFAHALLSKTTKHTNTAPDCEHIEISDVYYTNRLSNVHSLVQRSHVLLC